MPNLAALRAAIFLLSAKNRWGGGTYVPPPGRARVISDFNAEYFSIIFFRTPCICTIYTGMVDTGLLVFIPFYLLLVANNRVFMYPGMYPVSLISK